MNVLTQEKPKSQVLPKDEAVLVTDWKPEESLLTRQNSILNAVKAGDPLSEIMESTVRLIESQLPGLPCSILLLNEENHQLHHGASIHLPASYIHAIDGLIPGPNVGSCGTAVHERRTVIVEDTASDKRWEQFRDLSKTYNLKACWSVPFLSKTGEVLGTFAVYSHDSRTPSEDNLGIIQFAANLLSIAIDRDIASRALHKSEAVMNATYNYASVGIVIADMHQQFIMANRAYCNMMGYSESELKVLNFSQSLILTTRAIIKLSLMSLMPAHTIVQ